MRILILDDDHERHLGFQRMLAEHDCWHVYTYEAAIDLLAHIGQFEIAYLDHDLADVDKPRSYGEREHTGEDVARWIHDHPERAPARVVVHSWNPDGAKRMVDWLVRAGVPVVREPYGEPQ